MLLSRQRWTPELAERAVAIAEEEGAPVVVEVDAGSSGERSALSAAGLCQGRREFRIRFDVAAALLRLAGVELPPAMSVRSALDVDEDRLRALDDELRWDIPGCEGWVNDAEGFHAETFLGPAFNPASYLVAVDTDSDEYVGLCRIWMNESGPRLGMVGVTRPYRRRGVARALAAAALRAVAAAGAGSVVAEYDRTNAASAALAAGVDAEVVGESVEFTSETPLCSAVP